MLNFSISSIFASLIFGTIGIIVFRRGKKESNFKLLFIGLGLMLYTYFTSGYLLDWGLGLALSFAAYYYWSAA